MFENCSHSLSALSGRKRAVLALFFALAALCLLPRGKPSLSTRAGRCAYLAELGCEVDPASEELREITLPARFDAVLEEYERLQRAQGFSLRGAAGGTVLCCSYDLVSYPDWDGRVIAVLYLYRGRVIGGDLHTADPRGFMRPLLPDW